MQVTDFHSFQRAADRTLRPEDQAPKTLTGQETNLLLGAMGLASETGEFLDHVKKILFHDQKLEGDRLTKMLAELGDILWYHSCACRALQITMLEAAQGNVTKLELRHPNGVDFSYHLKDVVKAKDEIDLEERATTAALEGRVYRNEPLGGYTFVHDDKNIIIQVSDYELVAVDHLNGPVEAIVKRLAISKIKEALRVSEVGGE